MTDKLNELITEANHHTFNNNCYTSNTGTYCRPGVELQVWIADSEHFIFTYHGKDSVPGRLYSQFNSSMLEGYYQDEFDKQVNIVISALKVCLRIDPKIEQTAKSNVNVKLNKSRIFIVHGHDETSKIKTARFVEKLGFEAIILHEQASSSATIIEKIEANCNVGFGIILYTPCDIGGKNTSDPKLKLRARQNVVFEHGFLIGNIGRSNVCALVKGDVETPNDISGVVYVQMDDSDAWCYKVAKELKKAGYPVDLNKI